MAGPPLVSRAVRRPDLLNPPSGGEACRAEPFCCVAGELLVRHAGPADARHVLAETRGKGRRVRNTPVDLRGRDLGLVLGVASRVSLAEQAGAQEAGDGQPDDQR
jgi:hypothetical protein